jgi:hypothetical protein
MADLRRWLVLLLLTLMLLPAMGCMSLGDPMGKESDFRLIQRHFTQYVRWGKVHQAAEFVIPEQREEFMDLGHDLTDIRFTDWETLSLDFSGDTAHAVVQMRGYRLSTPIERTVRLNQAWSKAEDTGAWQVELELAALREGLGAAR